MTTSASPLSLPAYTPNQPAAEVDAALRQALAACDRSRECAVLWFAEVRRRELYRTLGYASLELYAVHELGFDRNRTWQFKRLADELDRLPVLREAVASGELGWTKARQVARVAVPATVAAWVATAKATGRRELERRVQAAQVRARPPRRGQGGAGAPAQLDFGGPGAGAARADAVAPAQHGSGAADAGLPSRVDAVAPTQHPVAAPAVTITLRADALQLARFEALVERARRLGAVPRGADRTDLVLAALDALVKDAEAARDSRAAGPAAVGEGDGEDEGNRAPDRHPAAPATRIIVHQCPDCGGAAVITARGERALAPAQLAAARCDAVIRESGQRNRAVIPPATRAAVLARDRHRCVKEGCGSTRCLEVHHVVPREAGGSNRAENLVTLCARCHRFAHEKERRKAMGLGGGA